MSITQALSSAKAGLNVVGARAELVATNIANASTPGYVRRSLTVSETILGNETSGVQITSVDRSEDARLTGERRRLASDQAQLDVLSTTWGALSQRIGEDYESSTLFQRLSDLDTALKDAALSPESTTHANQIVQSANQLAGEFNSLSALITQERQMADADIAQSIAVINKSLQDVEDLNSRIASVDRTTSAAAALMDERDRVLDQIAQYIPIQTFGRESGAVDVLTNEGVFLVAGAAKQIEFTPSNAVGPAQTLQNGSLSGLTIEGIDITPGAGTYGAVSSGSVAALFTLRDTDLPELETQLDTMAQNLLDRFNDPGIDPTNPAGSAGVFLDTDPTAGAGVAGRFQLNALVDPNQGGAVWRLRDGLGATTPGAAGDNSILTNLSDALNTVNTINTPGLQGSFVASDLIAQLGSLAGQKRVQNESVLSSVSLQLETVRQAEATETGVNIESEMQDLLVIEQAYAANARVIQAASRMVQELMEI